MMKKIILTIALVFSINMLFSQYSITGQGSSVDVARDVQNKTKLNNYTQGRTGTNKLNYFLEDEWKGGVMFTKDSASVNGYTYRYNIYSDQIELRSLVDPETINVLSIGRRKFIHSLYYDNSGVVNEGYFELVTDGDCKLLLRRSVKFTQTSRDIEGYGANESTSINEILFLKKGNEPAKELEKSKDFLEEYFSDKAEAVDYLNDKVIIFMTEKKVIELINYYNEI